LPQSIDGVAAAVEKDLKPAIENPENIENWKKSLSSVVKDAKLNARKSLQQVGANFNEAMADLKASSTEANDKMVKEAELGARNWGKTTSAITSTFNSTNTTDKTIVAKFTEMEDKATEMLKSTGMEIKDTTVNRKKSLENGWMSKKIGEGDSTASRDDSTAVVVKDNSSENRSSLAAAAAAAASVPVKEYEKNQGKSSTTLKESKQEASPPSTIIHAATVTAAATEIKKNLQDSTLDAVTLGGRHVSMLSAPMSTKNTTRNANTNAALGFSKSSSPSSSTSGSSSSPPGAFRGGSDAADRAGLDALKAAASAGVSATGAAAGDGNGNGDGGSAGGNGGDGSPDGGSSNNDGNKNNVYLLLLALALTGVGYYISQRQAKK
jgi:hypothetical protein